MQLHLARSGNLKHIDDTEILAGDILTAFSTLKGVSVQDVKYVRPEPDSQVLPDGNALGNVDIFVESWALPRMGIGIGCIANLEIPLRLESCRQARSGGLSCVPGIKQVILRRISEFQLGARKLTSHRNIL